MAGRPGGTLTYPELIPIHQAMAKAIEAATPHPGPHPTPEETPVTIPDMFFIVEQTRKSYPTPLGARHLDCLKSVAIDINLEYPELRAGLLDKPDGANVGGYAMDIICFPDGSIYDVLGDAEGQATPQWSKAGTIDPSRYRAVTVTLPAPIPSPEDLAARVTALEQTSAKVMTLLRKLLDDTPKERVLAEGVASRTRRS